MINSGKRCDAIETDSMFDGIADTFEPFIRNNSETNWNNAYREREASRYRIGLFDKGDEDDHLVANNVISSNFIGFNHKERENERKLNNNQEEVYNALFKNIDKKMPKMAELVSPGKIQEQDKVPQNKKRTIKKRKDKDQKAKKVKKTVTTKKKRNRQKVEVPIKAPQITQQALKKSEKQQKGKLHYLKALFQKLLNNQIVRDRDLNLSELEYQILRSLVKRKFKIDLPEIKEASSLKVKLRQINTKKSKKRPEENYKFVFKKCIRKLKDDFSVGEKRKMKRADIEREFYEFYFKRVSQDENMSLEQFYHPKNSKQKSDKIPKTLNIDYIKNLSKNPLFVERFMKYMYGDLKADYDQIVVVKINKLISKWEEILDTHNNGEIALIEISEYIELNKKCKFPWSRKEVDEAITVVESLFKEINKAES